jgi:hypothetical protein
MTDLAFTLYRLSIAMLLPEGEYKSVLITAIESRLISLRRVA